MKIGILQAGLCPEELVGEYGEYDAVFARFLDGFGFEFAPAGHVVISPILPEEEDDAVAPSLRTVDAPKNIRPVFVNELIEWGSTDFIYAVTPFGARQQGWGGLAAKVLQVQLPPLG